VPRVPGSNFPPRDERIMRIAMASLILGLKDSEKATRRCRKRVRRAIEILEGGATPVTAPFPDQDGAYAVAWLRRGCFQCRRCPGA
jgi:hypothetical protein